MSDLDGMVRAVAAVADVSPEEIYGPCAKRRVAWPRQCVYYMGRQLGLSYPRIGASLGRDHTSVLLGVRAVERRLRDGDAETMRIIERVNRLSDRHRPTFGRVLRAVSALSGIDIEDLQSDDKLPEVSQARDCAIYLAVRDFGIPEQIVGESIGRSTQKVRTSVRRAEASLEWCDQAKSIILDARDLLTP